MHITIVVGEASGDILGASLINSLKKINPSIRFTGIGGPLMIQAGLESLFDMERLSVMGIVEPLKRLPELLTIRKTIKQHCLEKQVDAFIGIDSPDFNLNIESFLKEQGIKTIHYVSPSVWAWRQKRIHKIKKSVDLMLTLFPFEEDFYREHSVPVKFVGHPLADQIAIEPRYEEARAALKIEPDIKLIALMPGSRSTEVAQLGAMFLQAAKLVSAEIDRCTFIIPAANQERLRQLEILLKEIECEGVDIRLLNGQSHKIMEAADVILLASGTTALEAMLLKKPMVVAYRFSGISGAIIRRMVKVPYVSLPNLLAGRELVPEYLHENATVDNLVHEIKKQLNAENTELLNCFREQHKALKNNAGETAAKAVWELVNA